ncbi:hypothetical protein BCR36DRAFT_336317 [Piromyces finnis]|uniref:Uncharacterized protein n=1 Tax=Piromyces finnis TaxID=1754191 RepID=A0A1Y1UYC8_9FUNG|nr:hypothetical protein BCR36DRAFT_336317 [Piromyces finnis]|eukprot:ORX43285.1 hypothetical protein BCR36DRAFT_336317 [Piromyces finnis]
MQFETIEKQVKILFSFCIFVQCLDILYFIIFGEGFIIEKIVYILPMLLFAIFPGFLLYALVKGNKYILVKFNILFEGLPFYYIAIAIKNMICWSFEFINNDISFFNLIDFKNPMIMGVMLVVLIVIIVTMIYSRNILKTYVKKLKTENRALIGESEEAVLLKMI